MLKLSDSRNFGRTFAGIALIVAPLLFLLGSVLDPAWADETEEYLNEVAADRGLYLLAGILNLIGALLLIAGLLGVIHLLRRRRVTLGQVGAALVMIGAVAIASTYVISVFEIVGTGDEFDREQVVTLFEDTEESGEAAPIFVMFLLGLVLGSILLAIGLWRQRAVAVWVPIVLVLSSVAGFVAGDSQASALVTGALLAVALIAIGLKILSVSDDDWERWEVLPQEREPERAPEAAPVA
jgi:Domain of unknown function (DUF4386)